MAHDWDRFVAQDWGRAPARLALGTAPLDAGDAFALARAIARPFRDGLRFFVLPALRFRIGDADIRAPGDLLPDASDASIGDYLQRLHARLPGEAAWLEIEQPLVADHAAWSAVRTVLQDLWDRAGSPVLPVVAHLLLGRFECEPDVDAAALLLPLHGDVRVRTAPADGAGAPCEWVAAPGDLIYWPGGWRVQAHSETGALALRLSLPQATAGLVREVRDLVIGMVEPVLYPDRQAPAFALDAVTELPDALRSLVRELPAFASGGELETALRVKWAVRCSACGLEPVPPRSQPSLLQAKDRIRIAPGVRIVALPLDDDMAIWAVNGHAIGVRAAAAGDAMRQRLEDGGVHGVADLCDGSGADNGDALRGVLDGLHAARGVVLEAPAGPCAPGHPKATDAAR